MSRFIQPLESRTLYSATPVSKATLIADQAVLVADAATAKASLATLSATATADTLMIQADLKGLAKTNLPLFRTLKADETKYLAALRRDLNAVIVPATALARKSIADASALMVKSTAAIQAKVAADTAALGTITDAPLAILQADSQGVAIMADLNALLAANPSDATLATDVNTLQSDAGADTNAFVNDVLTFQADLGAFAADVAAAPAGQSGSPGSTIPNLVGTFSGTATETAGKHVGRVSSLQIVITSETANGSLTGTAVVNDNGNVNSFTVTGTVSAGHSFTVTFSDPSGMNGGATLTGTASANTITGRYVTSDGNSGTFSIVKQ